MDEIEMNILGYSALALIFLYPFGPMITRAIIRLKVARQLRQIVRTHSKQVLRRTQHLEPTE